MEEEKEKGLKEERIRKVVKSYYFRKDIQDALVKFSQDREVSPRFFEGFGKRPDTLTYPSDVVSFVEHGATSFHCSEELWNDPLTLETGLDAEKLNAMRKGWDLVIDIDCKWFDYSKKAALSILKVLEFSGVKHYGIKYSGSKGFHIIVPSVAFPQEALGHKTSDMFPEWPRAIVKYLNHLSGPILYDFIKDTVSDFTNLKDYVGVKCKNCGKMAEESSKILLKCPRCTGYEETFISKSSEKKLRKCPNCPSFLEEMSKSKFFRCKPCELNSTSNPENFQTEVSSPDLFKILGLDVILVSPRHLFRMPYSLHEKTALASVVLTKSELENFQPMDADPFKIKPKDFIPKEAISGEASELLLQSLDFVQQAESSFIPEYQKNSSQAHPEFPKVTVKNLTENVYPPCIKNMLKGLKDGKKRALFVLINFFRSLGQERAEIEKNIDDWNKKNESPLKKGYIQSQIDWAFNNKVMLPPNCDKEHYKASESCSPDYLCAKIKNPVNYTLIKVKSRDQWVAEKEKAEAKKARAEFRAKNKVAKIPKPKKIKSEKINKPVGEQSIS